MVNFSRLAITLSLTSLLLCVSVNASCFDLDAGSSPYAAGIVLYQSNGSTLRYADSCDNHNRITEYYCDKGLPQVSKFVCKNYCQTNYFYSITNYYSPIINGEWTLLINSNLSSCKYDSDNDRERTVNTISITAITQNNSENNSSEGNQSSPLTCDEETCETSCQQENNHCQIGCHNYCNLQCNGQPATLNCSDKQYNFYKRIQ